MSFDKIYDVLIVGADSIGLASAISLRKRGIDNILVIDRTRSFRQVGQVVDILPKQFGKYEQLRRPLVN